MQIGVIGLGRMGGNIVRRLTRAGHSCVVYDANPATAQELAGEDLMHAVARGAAYYGLARLGRGVRNAGMAA